MRNRQWQILLILEETSFEIKKICWFGVWCDDKKHNHSLLKWKRPLKMIGVKFGKYGFSDDWTQYMGLRLSSMQTNSLWIDLWESFGVREKSEMMAHKWWIQAFWLCKCQICSIGRNKWGGLGSLQSKEPTALSTQPRHHWDSDWETVWSSGETNHSSWPLREWLQ